MCGGRYKGGALSHTLGHEFVARIDKLNIDAASQKPCHVAEGQRVVAEINCVADSCGCRDYHERAQHPERKAIGIFGADGAFAEYAIVPIVNIHPVPASVTDDEAMFVEPLAAACQISQQVWCHVERREQAHTRPKEHGGCGDRENDS